ncbi:MFS multidrug transporter [Penicillium samsonianum]|uniref:MFS multidrug transporter n=1 Tax=Penicillium samsonianum TaxID=1882272 RepID=UPI002547455A|nr:MFS multidrug transporter [Penicillium samsonianum]KAJ6142836.1 MFS multidrug transporter [Penicillium samsonianum]
MSSLQTDQQQPASKDSTNTLPLEDQKDLESQSNQETESLEHPLLYDATPPTVLVDFDGKDDPYHPMNWPFRKKVITTLLYGFTTCWITFASAIYSAGLGQVSEDFRVSKEVAASGISLMVFGFGLGPLLWAPLSEVYGRKWVVIAPYFVAAIFSFGTATAKDIQTVLITRFFAGLFGSAPVTNTGGVMADIWPPEQRGVAVVGYAITIVGGPTLGPIIGGALASSYLGWRWTEYLTGIIMMAQVTLDVLLLDESYPPVLLAYKARRLRFEGKNFALHAKQEEWNLSLGELSQKYLIRPFQMLGTPICLLMSIYASFVYGILYANLEAFSVEFQEIRRWGPVIGNLPFISLLVGIFFAAAVNIYNNKYYFKQFKANGNKPVPEARLPPMMVGGFAFTAGLFIFAWTSSPSTNYWPSIIGIALTGFGFTTIFQAALNYLIDTFTRFSASAVAANTFLRSTMAGAFPLFVLPLYHNIGVDWGTTIFGCIATVLIPVPFLFFFWGKQIRARGKWSKHTV